MAATYNDDLSSDKDTVRLLIGDIDTSNPLLQDEEINALLTRHSNNVMITAGWCFRIITASLTKLQILHDRSEGQASLESLMREFDRKAGEWLGR